MTIMSPMGNMIKPIAVAFMEKDILSAKTCGSTLVCDNVLAE